MSAPTSGRPGSELSPATSEVVDHHHIERVVHALARALDEHRFDDLRDLYTDGASVTTPGGTSVGIDAIVAQAARVHGAVDRVHHLIGNVETAIDGDVADVRANLLATFAAGAPGDAPYVVGEVYRLELRRSDDRWRISRLESTPVWSSGTRPEATKPAP